MNVLRTPHESVAIAFGHYPSLWRTFAAWLVAYLVYLEFLRASAALPFMGHKGYKPFAAQLPCIDAGEPQDRSNQVPGEISGHGQRRRGHLHDMISAHAIGAWPVDFKSNWMVT